MRISFKNIEHMIDRPDKALSNKGVILIAGSSAHALTDERYNALSEMLKEEGFFFLRFNLWESEAELNNLSLEDIYYVLNDAIEALKTLGCHKIGIVGKGFGGAICLTYIHPLIKSRVVWSPTIAYDSDKSTLTIMKSLHLSQIRHFTDLKINKHDLSNIKSPTLIIQGTKDEIVKKESSKKIYAALPHGTIALIPDAGHSFKSQEERQLVANKTVDFFIKTIR